MFKFCRPVVYCTAWQTFFLIVLTNVLKILQLSELYPKKHLYLLFQSIGLTKSTLRQTILYKNSLNFADVLLNVQYSICLFFIVLTNELHILKLYIKKHLLAITQGTLTQTILYKNSSNYANLLFNMQSSIFCFLLL